MTLNDRARTLYQRWALTHSCLAGWDELTRERRSVWIAEAEGA